MGIDNFNCPIPEDNLDKMYVKKFWQSYFECSRLNSSLLLQDTEPHSRESRNPHPLFRLKKGFQRNGRQNWQNCGGLAVCTGSVLIVVTVAQIEAKK